MSDLKPFPFTKSQVLALEYAKLKFSNETTPEDFYTLFEEACKKIESLIKETE